MAKTGIQPPPGADCTQTLEPRSGDSPATPEPARGTDPGEPPRTGIVDDPDRYRLAGEHARGGLGRVVRAVDTRLGRTVAVKELLKTSPQAEALFMREAMITARLQHPGIVPVHEAGRWPSGDPYYVMKLVQGRTLKAVIAEHPTLADRLALLPHAIAVAEAIGYAHSQAVIHRDIKPANVMVGDFGETMVVDWGLARDGRREVPEVDEQAWARPETSPHEHERERERESTSTVSGRVIGTPQYMPPEQARGDIVDERADVYSLGALLYELLAGHAPYRGDDPHAVLDAVLAGPPPRLARIQPGVPRDLDAVVAKAMARDPDERYPTAKELAEDLKRFQSGQLVSAQTYGRVALARRWIARHRGPVAVAAVAMLVVTAVAVGLVRRILDERNVARDATAQTQVALDAAEARQHALTLLQAHASLPHDPTAAIAWLKTYPKAGIVAAGIPALIDEAVAGGVARHVWRQRDWVYDARFSPDGRTVATASKDGDVRLYDVATGRVRVLGHVPAGVMAVGWSPDGARLATGGGDGQIQVWDLARGGSRLVGDQPEAVSLVRFSDDGARLLSRSELGPPRVWDVAKGGGRPLIYIDDVVMVVAVPADDWSKALAAGVGGTIWRIGAKGPVKVATVEGGVAALGVTRDGAVAIASDGKRLWRIEVASGKVQPLCEVGGLVKRIELSHDGRRAAVIGEDPDVFLVDTTTGDTRRLRGHTDAIYEASFSRDGRRLLTASDDGTARVWDLAGDSSRVLRGHADDVYRAHFSPDEQAVVTASLDGTARLWHLGRTELRVLAAGLGAVERLAVVDRGRKVIATSLPGRAAVVDLASGARTDVIGAAGAKPSWAKARLPVVSADGRMAAVPRDDGSVAVWVDGKGPKVLPGGGWLVGGAFSPVGDVAYGASTDGTVRAWDPVAGTERVLYQGAPAWGMEVSPDGTRLAVGTADRLVLLDTSGKVVASTQVGAQPIRGCLHGIRFDPAGDRIAAARCDGDVVVWTPASRTLVRLETSQHHVTSFAFSPHGRRLAGAMADRTVRIWDTDTGRLTATLHGHADLVMAVAWSPDGTRLASASYDRTLRVWDPATGASRVLRGHGGSVDSVAWTDDGRRLVSGSRDGTIRLWAAPSLAPPPNAELRARLDDATTAVIGTDDRPATPPDTTPAG